MSKRIGRTARKYASNGFHVLPLDHRVKAASTRSKTIREWWTAWPNARIGAVVGIDTGLLAVVVDGKKGRRALAAIEREHGILGRAAVVRNGRERIFLFSTEGLKRPLKAMRLMDGIRILGEGHTIRLPSKSGPSFRFANRRAPGDVSLAPAPRWLITSVKTGVRPLLRRATSFAVDDIIVPKNRRALQRAKVKQLAESMKKIGLNTPISVRLGTKNRPVLVAGWHRLEAAKSLRWRRIDAVIVLAGKVEARLREIAENLHRADLTELDRSEQLAEWVRALRKESKARRRAKRREKRGKGKSRVSGHDGQKRRRGRPRGGIAEIARRLPMPGKSRDAVQKKIRRSLKVDSIAPEAKARARQLRLDNNQAALLKVASIPAVLQVQKVEELANQKHQRSNEVSEEPVATTANATDQESAFHSLKGAWDQAEELREAWNQADESARARFLVEVLDARGLMH
jgi:ParB family transcriptional regulator, chromosome partitioning protein